MATYKIYRLTNKNSVIGFPFIALCQENSTHINYDNELVCIGPEFHSMHEADIDCYLDDYELTNRSFEFDYSYFLKTLCCDTERPVSVDYHKKDNTFTIYYHRWKLIEGEEFELSNFSVEAKKLIDYLFERFKAK